MISRKLVSLLLPDFHRLITSLPVTLSCGASITPLSAHHHHQLQFRRHQSGKVSPLDYKRFHPPRHDDTSRCDGAWRKNQYVRRTGYRPTIWQGDSLMPRLPDAKPYPIPQPSKENPWSEKKARFGQNDYIDILGDGSLQPWDLIHRGHPPWLRLVSRHGNEMQRLIRKRDYVMEYWQYKYPQKWHNLLKRIRFLYKKYNIRKNRGRQQ